MYKVALDFDNMITKSNKILYYESIFHDK